MKEQVADVDDALAAELKRVFKLLSEAKPLGRDLQALIAARMSSLYF